MLTSVHIAGMVLTAVLVTVIGWLSARRITSAGDFAVGGRAIGAPLVAGIIIGTLVGGASTVGTAQLAFRYGFSAWWFTLGGGIACLALGIFLAGPLRRSGAATGPEFLSRAYGGKAGLFAGIFSSLGMFFNIIGQVLSAVALLTAMMNISPQLAAGLTVLLLIAYVVFGGVWATGMVGVLKTGLLYLSMAAAGVTAWMLSGGWNGFTAALPSQPFFSLFGRGMGTDMAAGFSLLVGVLSTQTYLQAMFSAKNEAEARKGAVIAGLIIPPVGIAGILTGLYMRIHFPDIDPKTALPLFVLQFLPDWMGGIVLGTLILSVIGTGAGLVLGVSAMFSRDVYRRYWRPQADDREMLYISRACIIGVSLFSLLFVGGQLNSLILKWSFLSMGLRGSAVCLPLLAAVFASGRIHPRAGIAAAGLAPVTVIGWAVWGPEGIDPLYPGLSVSAITLMIGSFWRGKPETAGSVSGGFS